MINATRVRQCKVCGEREKVFVGVNCETEFCKWLFSEVNIGYTVIVHNLKGFDAYFLINYLIDNGVKPYLIFMMAQKYCMDM